MKGATKSRDSTTGIPSVCQHPCIIQAIQCTAGRAYSALHSLAPCNYSSTVRRGLLIHPRGGGLSWPNICIGIDRRASLAAIQAPRSQKAFPSLERGCCVENLVILRTACCTFLPAQGWALQWRNMVCYIRCGRDQCNSVWAGLLVCLVQATP
jgi:hypothetical protein